jgi:hypothetical protein
MWLDAPFFNILEKMAGLQSYFLAQAWFVARIVLFISLGFAAIKYAMHGEGLKDTVAKSAVAFILFAILMHAYPRMVRGINSVIYEWANISTYENSGVRGMFLDRQQDAYFWTGKLDSTEEGYSQIVQVIYDEGGQPQDLLLNIFDQRHQFISPNAVIRILMLITESILNKANKYSVWDNFDKLLLLFLTAIAVILCGVFGSLQYFICALEFTLITSVGVILLPFMLWDGSKFLTEKLIGALTGFFIKMLFCTITMLFTFYGYLAFMTRGFDGTINEVVYVIFISVFYMMLCQSGPQLAVTLLTGTPQMSLMEGVHAVGAYAAAGAAGGAASKFIAQKAAAGTVLGTGMTAQAVGAAGAVRQLGGSRGDAAHAALKSVGVSAATTVRSGVHNMGRSLLGSGGAGHGAGRPGGSGGINRFSSLDAIRTPTDDGKSKLLSEHLKAKYHKGQDIGLDHLITKEPQPPVSK